MLEELLSSKNAPLRRLSLSRLKMVRGDGLTGTSANGLFLFYILAGTVEFFVEGFGEVKIGERQTVDGHYSDISTKPCAFVIPSSLTFTISARTKADVLLAWLADGKGYYAFAMRPSDVREHVIGKDHCRRIVREVVGEDNPCELKCGETLNSLGAWSSWPPHDFERKPELAPKFEECFYYFGRTPGAVGYQRRRGTFVTGETVDDVCVVRPGDCLPIPLGEHPIVSAPDSQIGYVWFYYSPQAKHYARQADGSWLYD